MKYILGIEEASSTSSYKDVFEKLFKKEDNFQLSGSSKEQLLLEKKSNKSKKSFRHYKKQVFFVNPVSSSLLKVLLSLNNYSFFVPKNYQGFSIHNNQYIYLGDFSKFYQEAKPFTLDQLAEIKDQEMLINLGFFIGQTIGFGTNLDPNCQNVLFDKNNQIIFIDPDFVRGIFLIEGQICSLHSGVSYSFIKSFFDQSSFECKKREYLFYSIKKNNTINTSKDKCKVSDSDFVLLNFQIPLKIKDGYLAFYLAMKSSIERCANITDSLIHLISDIFEKNPIFKKNFFESGENLIELFLKQQSLNDNEIKSKKNIKEFLLDIRSRAVSLSKLLPNLENLELSKEDIKNKEKIIKIIKEIEKNNFAFDYIEEEIKKEIQHQKKEKEFALFLGKEREFALFLDNYMYHFAKISKYIENQSTFLLENVLKNLAQYFICKDLSEEDKNNFKEKNKELLKNDLFLSEIDCNFSLNKEKDDTIFFSHIKYEGKNCRIYAKSNVIIKLLLMNYILNKTLVFSDIKKEQLICESLIENISEEIIIIDLFDTEYIKKDIKMNVRQLYEEVIKSKRPKNQLSILSNKQLKEEEKEKNI